MPADGHVVRLSVTDRCNLRCRYCMPPHGVRLVRHANLLPLERLAALVGWLDAELGVGKIKLTGGEPLARLGLAVLVKELRAVPGVEEISMTTNGSLLAAHAKELCAAGLDRVNVSLDTVDPDRFSQLTRGGNVVDAVSGIDAALAAGLVPLKLNAVLLASSWRDDVPALLGFAASRGVEVRFIELMRTGTEAGWAATELVRAFTVQAWLERRTLVEPVAGPPSAPARRTRIRWRGREVTVGWITPQSRPFCAACNRLRLDARGRLRRCLMDPRPLELAQLLAEDAAAARRRLDAYLDGKRPPAGMNTRLPMVAVGG
ncbi:MAG: radical SAM protein [Acidobacteria bacterium]|nr:radical SAM protein [Acidobacteriota bacterium]